MSVKKQYLKSQPACRVTFRLPAEAAPDAGQVSLVGDFNDWNIYAIPLKKLKDGTFTVTVRLESDREYQFRYLIDEHTWENDWDADGYVASPYGNVENSVVVV